MKRKESLWYQFQEDIKSHFIALGAYAETNVKVEGARGEHDIDVLVKSKFLGGDVTWLIEAKDWKTKIPKEKALAFQAIVQDVGADRGFIISDKGFQRGAIKCVNKSNVSLRTFEDLKKETQDYIQSEIISYYEKRMNLLHKRYWAHPKRIRREYGLRHDLFEESDFSGTTQLNYIGNVIRSAKNNTYPIHTETGLKVSAGEKNINDFHQAVNWLNLNLNLLDEQLLNAEYFMFKENNFKPDVNRWIDKDKKIG
ncbi:restriction endonuclease [Duffyella gerundensis]|uniref:restriction endonuclease n=1 Tax=Duffyella gerundensis TaxID=1619313 RepID=UPI0021F790E4|nr:restriction endonuclease [Duffyella gerundensis]